MPAFSSYPLLSIMPGSYLSFRPSEARGEISLTPSKTSIPPSGVEWGEDSSSKESVLVMIPE